MMVRRQSTCNHQLQATLSLLLQLTDIKGFNVMLMYANSRETEYRGPSWGP